MADIWLSNYARVPLGPGVRGKPYQFTHNPKGCLHTTEGGSIAGARAAYAPYPPHVIYDWRTRQGEQHVPLNLASYSAMDGNDDDYMVQVELVGFAAETRNWPEQALRNIAADVIAPIEAAFRVPRTVIWHGFKDSRDGIVLATPNSPIRLSAAQLRDFSGWLGHQHLPAPDNHWDPGALPIARILSFLSEEDDMPLSHDDIVKLMNTPVQLDNPWISESGTEGKGPAGDDETKLFREWIGAAAFNALYAKKNSEDARDLARNVQQSVDQVCEDVKVLRQAGVPSRVELTPEDRAAIVADLAPAVADLLAERLRD